MAREIREKSIRITDAQRSADYNSIEIRVETDIKILQPCPWMVQIFQFKRLMIKNS